MFHSCSLSYEVTINQHSEMMPRILAIWTGYIYDVYNEI